MTSVKTHGPLTVGTIPIRRKPALTYQSPAQSTTLSRSEKSLFPPQSATAPSIPPPTHLSQTTELSQRSAVPHRSSRHCPPLLPLYHPFGTLALSLPDLDPTAFGLPAPVAVFDPMRRASNRQGRPAPKVRNPDDPAMHPPSCIVATPAPEPDVREKSSPRRRRGGGAGGRRRRREPEDGDATYPAKRPRHSRSTGAASGLSGARALCREEGSPALSNAHESRASPEAAEEKKPERRSTRSRGTIVRRDSTTTSEDTETSASLSVSATNTVVPTAVSGGEPAETNEPAPKDASDEATEAANSAVESKNAEPNDIAVVGQQDN